MADRTSPQLTPASIGGPVGGQVVAALQEACTVLAQQAAVLQAKIEKFEGIEPRRAAFEKARFEAQSRRRRCRPLSP